MRAGRPSSPWSSSRQSFVEEEFEDDVLKLDLDEDGEGVNGKYRVCVLGQNDAGKTALVAQFLTSEYIDTYDASLGKVRKESSRTLIDDVFADEEFGEKSVSVVLDGQESELIFIDHTQGEMSVSENDS